MGAARQRNSKQPDGASSCPVGLGGADDINRACRTASQPRLAHVHDDGEEVVRNPSHTVIKFSNRTSNRNQTEHQPGRRTVHDDGEEVDLALGLCLRLLQKQTSA